MWSLHAWRRKRILARHPVNSAQWHAVMQQLPILDGLDDVEQQRLRERAVLFLQHKHLSALPGVELTDHTRLLLAVQAELPLLHLADLNWYQGFHEIVLYPDDFVSPQRHRDASGVVHEWDAAHSGEAWLQGPVILAWPGVQASGQWDGNNLVIHELAHKLDMLNGDANGLPPLHGNMHVEEWSKAMQNAFDHMNAELDANPQAKTAIDAYAAENPAEFFAVTSEYFFSAPDLLAHAFPAVHAQLSLFYRQDPLARLQQLQANNPAYPRKTEDRPLATNG
jgi:MtfA peptidase